MLLLTVFSQAGFAAPDTEAKPETKAVEARTPEAAPEIKPEVKQEVKPEATAETKSEAKTPEAKKLTTRKSANDVTFNFVDVDLPVITKFISEITGKNFIFDEKVKGKITIIAPSKLSIDEAYNLFTSVLDLKGFTVVPSGVDAYKIVPSIEAKQQGLHVTAEGTPVNESYIARLITFHYVSADEAFRFFQPLVSKDGHVSVFGPGNLLLVIDSGMNVDKLLSLASLIDKPSTTELPEVIPLHNASADTVAKILNEGMGKSTRTRVVPGQALQEGATVIADARLNSVILFGDRSTRESMKALIPLLDTPAPEAQGRVNVYFLENADATELAKVLEGMIKGMQSPGRPVPGAAPVTPFESAGGITITADKASNALVVVASPADYQNLSQTIKQLDKRRRQVYVEAMIVEASMDKLRALGTQWRATAVKGGKPIAVGGFGTIDQTSFQNILSGLQGASVGGLGNFLSVPLTSTNSDGTISTNTLTVPGYAALFSLNDFRDAINVLSTPQLLTSDNKEAEILVGENVPFISQSQTTSALTTTSTSSSTASPVSGIVNSIVRQDVGVILRITPQITEGDNVKLDIYQEISQVKNQSDALTVSLGPTLTKRSTKTSVVVRDNETVVIGGLMSENDEETVTKMPVLGDIPILGWFFKTKNKTKNKINLLIFLSPHIIKESSRLAEITEQKQKDFATRNKRFAEGEVMVKFKDDVPEEKAHEIIAREGATVLRFIKTIGVYQLKMKKGQSVEDAVEEFSALPEVRYAEPNYTIKIQ